MANPMMLESVWFEKYRVDDAEKLYQENRAKEINGLVVQGVGLGIGVAVESPELAARLSAVEKENAELRRVTAELQAAVTKLTARMDALAKPSSSPPAPAAPQKREVVDDEDSDDSEDSDFGNLESEGDSAAYAKMVAERKAESATQKPKKVVIAKSSIVLDVKPWDDETDMKDIEKVVRAVKTDGLVWGASKLVPVGYGIKKLQISCVVEDDKVGTDFLEEEITKHEDLVQSVDIAAFNKI